MDTSIAFPFPFLKEIKKRPLGIAFVCIVIGIFIGSWAFKAIHKTETLGNRITQTNVKIEKLESDLKADIKELKTDLREDIKDLKAGQDKLENRLDLLIDRLIKKK